MNNIDIFEKNAAEYDLWFEENEAAYKSEILALRDLIPAKGVGLEIGVGTGRFAGPQPRLRGSCLGARAGRRDGHEGVEIGPRFDPGERGLRLGGAGAGH